MWLFSSFQRQINEKKFHVNWNVRKFSKNLEKTHPGNYKNWCHTFKKFTNADPGSQIKACDYVLGLLFGTITDTDVYITDSFGLPVYENEGVKCKTKKKNISHLFPENS